MGDATPSYGDKQVIQRILPVGPLQCNCVVLGCERTKEAVVIDPGADPERILEAISSEGLRPKYLLHTHAHFDHVCGTRGVREVWEAPTCLHAGDEALYKNVPMQGKFFGFQLEETPPLEKLLEDEEILSFGDLRLQTLHTPGHSPGSVSFKLLNGPETLYSGDTLFYRSIGRADLWGGDADLLLKSIRDRLFVFEGELEVVPGHGPVTRLGDEKKLNPFLQS